jgi:oligoribonuclease
MAITPYLVWIDLEMTGLDPKKNRIIEIAVIITDNELNIIDDSTDLVIHQSKIIMNRMDSWNRLHHGKSGLTQKVLDSEISLSEARKKVSKVIEKYCQRKTGILCGNSVYVDRMFIRKYFPLIDKYLGYRMIDVTSIKELGKRWYPEEVKSFLGNKEEVIAHRALDDIKYSIRELRFYRETIFKK